MKVELCRFNEVTIDGRVIRSANTTWTDPMRVFTLDHQLAGFVTDVHIEDNRLYGDLDFELDLEMFCLTVGMDRVNIDTREEDTIYVTGRVMYAQVSEDDRYPWKD